MLPAPAVAWLAAAAGMGGRPGAAVVTTSAGAVWLADAAAADRCSSKRGTGGSCRSAGFAAAAAGTTASVLPAARPILTSSQGDCRRLPSPRPASCSCGLGDCAASISALRLRLASAAAAASSPAASAACCSAAAAAGARGGRPAGVATTRCALPSTPSRRGFSRPACSLLAAAAALLLSLDAEPTRAVFLSSEARLMTRVSSLPPTPRCASAGRRDVGGGRQSVHSWLGRAQALGAAPATRHDMCNTSSPVSQAP